VSQNVSGWFAMTKAMEVAVLTSKFPSQVHVADARGDPCERPRHLSISIYRCLCI